MCVLLEDISTNCTKIAVYHVWGQLSLVNVLSMCGIHCLIALISVHFQNLGALSCILIFLNSSDVSSAILFLVLYYYLSILDVMTRLPLVLVWAWYVLLTDCTIVLSPVYYVLTLFEQINDDDEIGPYLLLIGNKKSQVASRSVLIPMTLSDLERRDATDQIFWRTSVITLVSFHRERPNRHLWDIFSESATPPLPRRWSPASPTFLGPFLHPNRWHTATNFSMTIKLDERKISQGRPCTPLAIANISGDINADARSLYIYNFISPINLVVTDRE